MDKDKIIMLSLVHARADVNPSAVPAPLPFLATASGYSYTEATSVVFCHSLVSALAQTAVDWMGQATVHLVHFLHHPSARLLRPRHRFPHGLPPPACGSLIQRPWRLALPSRGHEPDQHARRRAQGCHLSLFAIDGNAGFALCPVLAGLLVPVSGLHGTRLFPLLALLTAKSFLDAFRRMPQLKKMRSQGTSTAQASNRRAFSWLAWPLSPELSSPAV